MHKRKKNIKIVNFSKKWEMESKKCNGSPYARIGQDNYLSAAISDGCGQNDA